MLDAWRIAAGHLGLGTIPADTGVGADAIVWQLRAPRIVLAAIAGAGLAVIGVVVQGVTRNALADPYLLGLSAGASLGAVTVVAFGLGAIGSIQLTAGAFCGAAGAFAVVLAVAQLGGRIAPVRTILAGVAIGELCAAATAFLTIRETNADATRSLLVWLLGGFSGAAWSDLLLPAAIVLLALIVAIGDSRTLDALALGDDTASSLGIAVDAARRRLLVVSALATAVLVATCGAIGFVGLVLPHIARFAVGGRHRRVLPVAALAGALLMVWVDAVARTAFAPEELPVGVVTALIGAPFFVVLLRRQGRRAA
jgi:iron complex transport system permease protein